MISYSVYQALRLSVKQPTWTIWRKSPFSRYHQLWSQLKLREGVVYRTYIPGPTSEAITVPVLLACLRKEYLRLCHDSATGGHQGWHKTLHKLRREAYWVNMAQDAHQHCRECNICQRTKLMHQTGTVDQHSSWQTMADGSSGYIGSTGIIKQQQVHFSCTRLFYKVGRC